MRQRSNESEPKTLAERFDEALERKCHEKPGIKGGVRLLHPSLRSGCTSLFVLHETLGGDWVGYTIPDSMVLDGASLTVETFMRDVSTRICYQLAAAPSSPRSLVRLFDAIEKAAGA